MLIKLDSSHFNRSYRILALSIWLTLVCCAFVTSAHASSVSDAVFDWIRPLTQPVMHRVRIWQNGVQYDHQVLIPVAAQEPLQASLYLPKRTEPNNRSFGTILVMLPYGRHQYGEALRAGIEFSAAGFAVVTLDLRGYESDNMTNAPTRRLPWAGVTQDASAALDWIIKQPWSNGRVGTFGCSALGETQFALGKANHPAHRAMLASGAGGAMGELNGRYGYFGLFEGGTFQLASGYGWLARRGWLTPPFVRQAYPQAEQRAAVLASLARLPITSQVDNIHNAWGFITGTPLGDPAWRTLNYIHEDDSIRVPTLTINTWADQTLSESILLHQHVNAPGKRLILAPGDHCNHEQTPSPNGTGWQTVYNQWFDQWLKPANQSLVQSSAKTQRDSPVPPVSYRLPNDDQWRSAKQWPPESSVPAKWFLASAVSANSVNAGGLLQPITPNQARTATIEATNHSDWLADPADPVPSVGGPVCCTSTPAIISGAVDQQEVEQRPDVLVFTSEPFENVTEFAGPVQATLYLSSDAPDADLIVRITDVSPDGHSINVQEGAQRVSQMPAQPSAPLATGSVIPVTVNVRDLAHRFEPGHRLRIHVAASSFPRLARNLQVGGFNRTGSRWLAARHRLHHSSQYPSAITLTQLTYSGTGK